MDKLKLNLIFSESKKHSHRYDAADEKAPVRAIYIMKHSLPNPPPAIQLTIEDATPPNLA